MWRGLLCLVLSTLFPGDAIAAGQAAKATATVKQAVAGPTSPRAAGERSLARTRHSGRVVAVDPESRILTFEEMSAWTPHQAALVKRTIQLAAGADVGLIARVRDRDPKGWRGGFVESSMHLSGLLPGDWVTVVIERDGAPMAMSIDVVRPDNDDVRPRR